VLRLDPRLAPVKAAVLPLSATPTCRPRPRPGRRTAPELERRLRRRRCHRRRYRRQDEIGTPFCVTVDFDTLDDRP
jgi:glycyl-tRNA synthetase